MAEKTEHQNQNLKKLHHHAIMVPAPLQGHVIPFANLAIKLASAGFTITFLNTQITHSKITQARKIAGDSISGDDDIFSGAKNLNGLDIRYETISDGFDLRFDRPKNHNEFMEGLMSVFPTIVDEFIGKLKRSDVVPPVTCLIADSFFVWPSAAAEKHGIVNVSFWTEPALAFTMYYHMELLLKNGHFGSRDNRKDKIDYIPGVEAIEPKDLPSYIQDPEPWSVMHRYIFKSLEDASKAEFIICNTAFDLEPATVSALQQKKSFYPIGPVFTATGLTKTIVPTSFWPVSRGCLEWLSSREKASVLYISFGSLAKVEKEAIQEIAEGVLLSNVSFVWALRPDIAGPEGETNLLPDGFEDETRGRGLVVPWCRQVEVLSHSAIGGFLTHCGWNSVLESVWCGVPMLCFPLQTDQFTNRKLVVEDWKVGVDLRAAGEVLERREVAEKMNQIMTDADELREKIEEMKMTLQNASAPNGSSQKHFEQFMQDIKIKIQQKSNASNNHMK